MPKQPRRKQTDGRVDAGKLTLNFGKYRVAGDKRSIRAVRMERPFFVRTPDGVRQGEPGDWLIKRFDGGRHVVSDEKFNSVCSRIK